MKIGFLLTFAILLAFGCTSAPEHRAAVQDDTMDRVTVGTVQKEIRIGMSGGEVAAALGSPNIVSTDENRDEIWIYDKIATDVVYSQSKSGVLGVIIGGGSSVGAGGVGFGSTKSGAESRSQRTLTVVVKFDGDKRVRDFAYHTTRF